MASRLTLHEELCTILGSRNVYFQPPQGFKMHYPCIKYERASIRNFTADNDVNHQAHNYTVIVIDQNPDSIIVDKISKLPRVRHQTHYSSEGLNHDVFNIYY